METRLHGHPDHIDEGGPQLFSVLLITIKHQYKDIYRSFLLGYIYTVFIDNKKNVNILSEIHSHLRETKVRLHGPLVGQTSMNSRVYTINQVIV